MRVAVLDDVERAAERSADWSGLDVEFVHEHLDPDRLAAALQGFPAIVVMRERTPISAGLLDALPELRLIVTTGTRNAAIDLAACEARDVTVCGTRAGGPAPAELAWALILSAARQVVEASGGMRAADWTAPIGFELSGQTLGIIGLGNIGTRVAGYARAFDMDVVAWSPHLTAERCAAAEVRLATLPDLLEQARVVTIHLALAESTRGLLGTEELTRMRPDAWLVNTSRAAIVDEPALIAALESGAIAGACIDVYLDEPPAHDHPLRLLRNVIPTPHIGYVTEQTYMRWYEDAVEAIHAFIGGQPVRVLRPG